MTRLLGWPVNHPRTALGLAVAITLVSLLLIFRLKPETSLAGLLDRNDPSVAAMSQVLDDFPVANETLVLASLYENASSDDQHRLIDFAERLTTAVANDHDAPSLITAPRYQPDRQTRSFVEKVLVPNGLYYLDDAQVKDVLHRLTRQGMKEQLDRDAAMLAVPGPAAGALAKTLARDPLQLHDFLMDRLGELSLPGGAGHGGPFFSPDGRSLLIRIGGLKSAADFIYARQVVQVIQKLIDQANTDHLHIDIAGGYAMSAHSATMIQSDSYSDIISTILGLAILFAIACRRPVRLFIYAFFPVAAGMLWGFGAYALIWHTITPLAAVVGGTLGAIGVDYTTHFIAHYQDNRPKSRTTRQAVLETTHELLLPSLAAWLTSVIGFAAVGVSPIRVLRDFSILGTLSLVGAWMGTLLMLPAMLMLFSPSSETTFPSRFHGERRLFDFLSKHALALTILSCLLMATLIGATLFHGVHIEMESDPTILHPRPSPPLEAQRRITSRMQVAAGSILIHLRASSAEQLVTLSHAVHDRLHADALQQAGISGCLGLASLLPDPATVAARRAALPSNLADSVEVDFRAALADSDFKPAAYEDYIHLLRKLVAPGGVPGIDTLVQYPELSQLLLPRDPAQQSTEAVTLVFTKTPLDTRAAGETALAAARNAMAGLDGATVTGTVVIGQDLESAVQRDLPRFVIISFVCIAAYLLIHFRSITLAAFALLPSVVSVIAVLACFCLFGVKLNLLHTVMAPLLLGTNLDYGIFAVYAWRDARDRGDMRQHFTPAFSALMMCGGATTIGFGSLVITSIPAIKSLGWLVNVGVVSCVIATLFIQWPVMLLGSRKREKMSVES